MLAHLWAFLCWLAPYAVTAYFVLICGLVVLLALRGHADRAHGGLVRRDRW